MQIITKEHLSNFVEKLLKNDKKILLEADKGVKHYDNVLEMSVANDLKEGFTCITNGYYSKGDGGGARYKIVKEPDVNSEFTVSCKNNLVGVLLFESPINVRKIGVSEDSNNNSDLIQKALNLYGNVYIPKGKYNIKKTIKLNSGNKLCGDGNGTILKLADGCNCDVISCDTCDHFTVSGIRIDGNKTNNSYGNGIVIECANPMSTWSFVENVFVEYCAENGLWQKLNPWQTSVRNCTFSECSGYGILNEATDVMYSDIYISNCKGGFKELGSSNKISDVKISGSGLKDTVDDTELWGHGFYAINSSRDMLANIEVQENRCHGFKLINCNDSIFSSCCSDRNGLICHAGNNSDVWAGLYLDGCTRILGNMIIQNYRNDGTQRYGLFSNSSEVRMDLIVRNCSVYYNFIGSANINCKINGSIINNLDKTGFPSVDVYENILDLLTDSTLEYTAINNGFISIIGSSSSDDSEIIVDVYDSYNSISYGDSRVVNNGKGVKILVPVERGVKVKITKNDAITLTRVLFLHSNNIKI